MLTLQLAQGMRRFVFTALPAIVLLTTLQI
jgi:hypothetical protein